MKPIWYPLFTFAIICLLIRVLRKKWGWWRGQDSFDTWFPVFIGAMLTLLSWVGAMGLATCIDIFIGSNSDQEWQVCWRARMVSMRSNDGVSGSIVGGIFMISGHIGSEQFYHWYTSENNGALHPHRWKSRNGTTIYEEDRKDGECIQFDEHFTKEWVTWFANPSNDLRMDFHIPKGSVHQEFSLQ